MAKWVQLLVTGITVGSIYSLIALGYVTIYRTSRIVNMAQGAFVMFGAFFVYSFLSEIGLPYWLSAILSIVCVSVLGVVMYLLVLRPLIKVSLVSIILATMALSILFENVALLKWGGYGKSVPAFTGDKALFIGKVAIFPQSLWVIGLMVLVLIGLYALINLTRVGKQMTATANDPAAASLSGVNTGRMILLAFIIMGHPQWQGSEISVFTALPSDSMELRREELARLIHHGRIPVSMSNVTVMEMEPGKMVQDYMEEHSRTADLVMTGFSADDFCRQGAALFEACPRIPFIVFARARVGEIELVET